MILLGSDYEPGVEEEEDSEDDVSLLMDLTIDLDMGEGVMSLEDEGVDAE